ncbi:TRAP-type C4-dicarboxylate transport system, periplasmic component [hydrothermal vent metagenome]|uniref:TRAP-type C4-dicarboxylate transport system, periplasmic component n=1 Tax=hydrothermal vent metagenome TaxID=652676 RepID=A0A3B0XPF4_9ZZZZ
MVLRITALLVQLCLIFTCFAAPAQAQKTFTLKFATLIPADTAWMNSIQAWSDELKAKSNGRLQLKIYPGGVMGDEPDVLRKIRSQQLHGAFFTGYGIGRIYPPARVLEMPFLFKNTDESDFVRNKIMPDIEKGFSEKGFELLGWPEVGFLHFFSKQPINSLEELKTRHIWLWQGDPMGEAFSEAAGVSPVPLSIMDVYTQLSAQHGSIDTVYNSPFGALAMQWHTKLKYASNVPLTNAIGGLVVSHRFYNKLPEDLKQLLKSSGATTADKINRDSRRDNQKSIALLKQSGIQFTWDWTESEKQQMLEIRNQAAKTLADSGYIPEQYFSQTKKILSQYRTDRQTEKP